MLLSEYLHWGIKFHLKQSLSVAKDHPRSGNKTHFNCTTPITA